MNLTTILSTTKGNSFTKYPSILTYHKMGNKGCLSPELSFPEYKEDTDIELFVTEKIDGTNTRILIYNGDYVIGSREEWVYAKGDRVIQSNAKGWISFMKEIAERITPQIPSGRFVCIYGELYGSKLQKSWKHYTSKDKDSYGFRVFDMWHMEHSEFNELFASMDENQASAWRESNQQPWSTVDQIQCVCKKLNLECVPYLTTAHLSGKEGLIVNSDIMDSFEFLCHFRHTKAALDDSQKQNDEAEGVVIRSKDRKFIAKLRFEDYERTIRKMERDSLL